MEEVLEGEELQEKVDSDDEVAEEEETENYNSELDDIADISIEILQSLFKPFDLGDITIDEYDGDEGELILDITGNDLGVLIGRYGHTLEALQYILTTLVRKKLGYYYPVIVDIEGYKNRQRLKLESLAKSAARKAISRDTEVSLRPMSSYERRIIHIVLKEDSRVETESEGSGSDRHVVVYPV